MYALHVSAKDIDDLNSTVTRFLDITPGYILCNVQYIRTYKDGSEVYLVVYRAKEV